MSELVKTVDVQLDRTRKMRLTLGDARRFMEATRSEEHPKGISILRGDLATVDLDESQWLELFASCLRHEDPELTAETLGEVIDLKRFQALGAAFEELMRDFMPEPDASEQGAGEGVDPSAATAATT